MPTVRKFRCNNCGERFDVEVLTEDEAKDARERKRPTHPIQCPKCYRTDIRAGWE
jgi:hypothetical protein